VAYKEKSSDRSREHRGENEPFAASQYAQKVAYVHELQQFLASNKALLPVIRLKGGKGLKSGWFIIGKGNAK